MCNLPHLADVPGPFEEEEEAQDSQVYSDVDFELAQLGITSEYRVSLSWMSTADLDIYVKNVETGEKIYYSNTESEDGNTLLDADNRGGELPEDRKTHVENISFNGDVEGHYAVYVNNHNSNSDVNEIPFTVVTKVGSDSQLFEDSWDINELGAHTQAQLGAMMEITTINIEGSH